MTLRHGIVGLIGGTWWLGLTLAALAGCDDPNGRVCNLSSSSECGSGESCVVPGSARCPPAEESPKEGAKACVEAGKEVCAAMGTTPAGQACEQHTDCTPGHLCIGVAQGVCRPRCEFTIGKCPAGQVCLDLLPHLPTPDNLGYCTGVSCDPLLDTGCATNQACYGGAKPSCALPGTAIEGQACKQSPDCIRGMICLPGQGTCVRLCDARKTGIEAGCAANDPCEALSAGGQPLSDHQGYCHKSCNPATDEGCVAEAKCLVRAKPVCVIAGSAKIGQACKKLGDCERGATCVTDSNMATVCAQKCDPKASQGTDGCAAGLKCVALEGTYPTPVGTCQ